MVVKKGLSIPGYIIKSEAGRSSCSDIIGAFNAIQLDAPDFLQCCDLRLETSKTNPDKRGLIDAVRTKRGITKAAAKREVKRILEPFMRTPKEVLKLKALNEPEEEETNA